MNHGGCAKALGRRCTIAIMYTRKHETKETKKNITHIGLDQASKTTRSSNSRRSPRRVGTRRVTVPTCRTISRRSDLKTRIPTLRCLSMVWSRSKAAIRKGECCYQIRPAFERRHPDFTLHLTLRQRPRRRTFELRESCGRFPRVARNQKGGQGT